MSDAGDRPGLPPGTAAAVRVEPARSSTPKGSELSFAVEHRNLPAGAGLVLTLVRDVPEGQAHGYAGATGPLMLEPLAVSGSGRTEFRWNGREVGCAPTDFPTWCPVEVGRYRVQATVIDRTDVGLVGWPDQRPRTVLAQSLSSPFLITGEADLGPLQTTLLGAAMQHVADRLFAAQRLSAVAPPHQIGRSLRPLGPVRRTSAGLCSEFEAVAPFAGRLTACLPAGSLSEAGLRVQRAEAKVSGDVSWARGVLPYGQAEAAALAVADAAYLPRVRFRNQPTPEQLGLPPGVDFQAWSRTNPGASTYLSSQAGEWTWRADLNAWAIVISEIMAGGRDDAPGRFADNVLVRVDQSGRACVVKAVPYKSSLGLDIAKDPLPCR